MAMKKLVVIVFMMLLVLTMAACTGTEANIDDDPTSATTEEAEVTTITTQTEEETATEPETTIEPETTMETATTTQGTTTTTRPSGLSAAQERQIKLDWFFYLSGSRPNEADFDPGIFHIDHYFGTYNGSVALVISGRTGIQVVQEENVAGVVFRYASPQLSILIWNDGTFLSLSQAYRRGLLTGQTIRDIHRQHQQAFPFMYSDF